MDNVIRREVFRGEEFFSPDRPIGAAWAKTGMKKGRPVGRP